jgi:ferric-dicitrate binding protein FerR (iron transport regulator)
MNDESHIWSLMTRKLSGEATAEELAELEELLGRQSSWQYAYEMLAAWWPLQKSGPEEKEAEESLDRLKEQIRAREFILTEEEIPGPVQAPWETGRQGIAGWKKWMMAAAVLLVVVASMFYFMQSRPPRMQAAGEQELEGRSEISTRYGSKSKVILPDGTSVWLNSGSNLTYSNHHFGEAVREVMLTGEAFFDVAHDAAHPFIIHTGKINVRVLGTAFDIKSYPGDKTIEATLLRGSIEVTFLEHPRKKVLLKPHQKLTVYNGDRMLNGNLNIQQGKNIALKDYEISEMTINPADSLVVETAWLQNRLIFRSETFEELAVQMERWYNVKINFSDSRAKQYRFTGAFENESLEEALKALQITAPFHYRIEKNEVYISNP